MAVHPLSLMAQKMLHARKASSKSPATTNIKSAPPVKAAVATPKRNTDDLMDPIDSSVLPNGSKAPRRKGSIKAARAPQADSAAEGLDPVALTPGFADGGPFDDEPDLDVESAGASSAFKGPKSKLTRGAPGAPKAPAYQPTEAMRELPQEVKPPPGPDTSTAGDRMASFEDSGGRLSGKGAREYPDGSPYDGVPGSKSSYGRSPGVAIPEDPDFISRQAAKEQAQSARDVGRNGQASDHFADLGRDLPKGDGSGPSPFAEAAPAAEAALPGAAAIIKRWGPIGAVAMLPYVAKVASEAAGKQLDKRTQEAMDDAGTYQGAKTSQMLQAQKYLKGETGANDPNGPKAMALHGSDADRAIAEQFMRHLKKNPAGPR